MFHGAPCIWFIWDYVFVMQCQSQELGKFSLCYLIPVFTYFNLIKFSKMRFHGLLRTLGTLCCGILLMRFYVDVVFCWRGILLVWHFVGMVFCYSVGMVFCWCGILLAWNSVSVAFCRYGVLLFRRYGIMLVWYSVSVAFCRYGVLLFRRYGILLVWYYSVDMMW